jgi:hypothetical protein
LPWRVLWNMWNSNLWNVEFEYSKCHSKCHSILFNAIYSLVWIEANFWLTLQEMKIWPSTLQKVCHLATAALR